jgi:hypothetical protein
MQNTFRLDILGRVPWQTTGWQSQFVDAMARSGPAHFCRKLTRKNANLVVLIILSISEPCYRLPRSNTAQLALYVVISYDKKGGMWTNIMDVAEMNARLEAFKTSLALKTDVRGLSFNRGREERRQNRNRRW